MNLLRCFLTAGLLLVLFGCEVGPNYHRPRVDLPGQFDEDAPATRAGATQPTGVHAIDVDINRWWRSLDDDRLDALIDQAVRGNLDVQIALTRIQSARQEEDVLGSAALPALEASGGVGRGSGTNSVRGRVAPALHAGTNTGGLKEITQVAGFDAAWELDLFGRFRREGEAATAQTQAAIASRNAALISLIADVARAYYDGRASQLRLSLLNDNIAINRRTLDLAQSRYSQGFTNELDVALAQREVQAIEARVEPLRAQIAQDQRRIAVLTGRFPAATIGVFSGPTTLPAMPGAIAPGLPVGLLRRRPDVQNAERELAAATAQVGVATAALFPRLILTGAQGVQGQGFGVTPNMTKNDWSIGPAAYWPLLDFGAIDAVIEQQNQQAKAASLRYRSVLITAVAEVDDAMANYRADQAQVASLESAVAASQRAVDLATQRYDRGFTDFLNVLDAERQLYALQDEYAVAQEQMILQFIAIYKALGGGWEEYQDLPPAHQPQPAIIASFSRAFPMDPDR